MDVKAGYSLRMLQIAEVLSGENSEAYAQYLVRVLKTIEGEDTGGKVIQEVVDYALTYIRTGAFPRRSRYKHSPATRSLILYRRWDHSAIDSTCRRKHSDGTHLPLNRNCTGLRV